MSGSFQGRDADQVVEQMMNYLRRGELAAAEEALARVEFLSHYGTGSPSWRGMHNLGHVIRTLLTSHAMHTRPGERQLNLTDPITAATVTTSSRLIQATSLTPKEATSGPADKAN